MPDVRVLKQKHLTVDGSKYYRELAGTSTQRATYPIASLGAGSTWIETDTGTVYVYNEAAGSWTEIGGA